MTARFYSTRIVTALLGISLLLSGCIEQGKAPDRSFVVAQQALYSAHLNQDGQWLLTGSYFHGGSLWSTRPPERYFDWNHQAEATSPILGAAFAANGRYAATNDRRTIVLWDLQSGEAISYWTAPAEIESMQLTADGSRALLGLQDNSATLFDIQKGGIRARLTHDDIVYSVSLSNDSLLAATGSADSKVRLWRLDKQQLLLSLDQTDQVRTVALSPDGRLLFASATGEPGRLYETGSGRLVGELPALRGYYSAARFSAAGDRLLVGTTAGQISLWQTSTVAKVQEWHTTTFSLMSNRRTQVEDVAWAADGSVLAVSSNGELHFLSL